MTSSPSNPAASADNADPHRARGIDQADIAGLRRAVRGSVHRPGDPGYPTVGFNLAISRRPWAVVDVADATDVAAVVGFAAVNAMTVTVFATGHGGALVDGHSILIRTGRLDTCEIDAQARTARVGAGVRWQQVIDAAAPTGLAPLCGSAPHVGVVGFLAGGGIGPLVRTVGASSDHIRSITVVTGSGELKQASAQINPELFWGLRGGKATLGIITEVVIDLLPIAEIYGGAIYFDGSRDAEVLARWSDWALGLPAEANTSAALLRLPEAPGVPGALAGRLTVAVRYAAVAPTEHAARLLEPIRALGDPLLDTIGVMPYPAIGAIHADPVAPMPAHDDGRLLHALPPEALDALLEVAGRGAQVPLTAVELRRLGGAFAAQPAVRSALCHRDAAFNLHIVGVLAPPVAEQVPGAAGSVISALQPWSSGAALPNFISAPQQMAACYDEDTRAWLSALAPQLDPRGVLDTGLVMR